VVVLNKLSWWHRVTAPHQNKSMMQATKTICLGCFYVPKGWERDMGFGIIVEAYYMKV
jgi:hypothetical protein